MNSEYKKRICLGLDCNRLVLGDRHKRFCEFCKQDNIRLQNGYSESYNNISFKEHKKKWNKATTLEKWRLI